MAHRESQSPKDFTWQKHSSSYTCYSILMLLYKEMRVYSYTSLLMSMSPSSFEIWSWSHEFFFLCISYDSIVKVLWREELNNNCKCSVDSSIAKECTYLMGHLWYPGMLIMIIIIMLLLIMMSRIMKLLTKIMSNIEKNCPWNCFSSFFSKFLSCLFYSWYVV